MDLTVSSTWGSLLGSCGFSAEILRQAITQASTGIVRVHFGCMLQLARRYWCYISWRLHHCSIHSWALMCACMSRRKRHCGNSFGFMPFCCCQTHSLRCLWASKKFTSVTLLEPYLFSSNSLEYWCWFL